MMGSGLDAALDAVKRTLLEVLPALLEKLAPFVVTALCVITMLVFLADPIDPTGATRPNAGANAAAVATQAQGQPAAGAPAPAPAAKPTDRWQLRLCVALTAATAMLWGVHCFTGDPYLRRSDQVRFAYFVMTASFLVFALPLVVKNQAVGTEPVGVLSACILGDGGKNPLSCRAIETSLDPALDCAATAPAAVLEACKAAKPGNFHWVLNVGGTLSVPGNGAIAECRNSASRDPNCKLGSQENRAAITGGMVVPLPFLFIALAGGAISMSRRIPEIQKRSEPRYVGTIAEPKLQPCEVREALAFQILQFVSAPLLAIVAYQVVHPESASTAAALAFMSGFGSEAVLLAIRGIFDGIKVRPTLGTAVKANLRVFVHRASVPVARARVGLVDGSQSGASDAAGRIEFTGVAVGAGQVTAAAGGAQRTVAFDLPPAGLEVRIDLARNGERAPAADGEDAPRT